MSPDYMDPERQRGLSPETLENPYGIGPTDTQRLEWLVNEGYIMELRRYRDGWTLEDTVDNEVYEGNSFREAIDAAMRAQPGA